MYTARRVTELNVNGCKRRTRTIGISFPFPTSHFITHASTSSRTALTDPNANTDTNSRHDLRPVPNRGLKDFLQACR
ncbi:hypothetical protein MHYP_G00241430 [Metynnis hypsauchen]